MEEALEEVNNIKNIFSFIFQKFLEEWKKLGKKFGRPGKNSGNVGRMEEAVEEENNSKLKTYILSFSKIFWKNGRSCGRRK